MGTEHANRKKVRKVNLSYFSQVLLKGCFVGSWLPYTDERSTIVCFYMIKLALFSKFFRSRALHADFAVFEEMKGVLK